MGPKLQNSLFNIRVMGILCKILRPKFWDHGRLGTVSLFPWVNVVLLSGVDYVVIGFDMEVQPLVTHNAA